ncbi:unannotated protein [freshwater metagenome]|uniref:Unannotated protein n=1 Tax=freshwater metagenome TaxID=449393 RepID=A0A6J6NPW4_9ZZZZ
MPRTPLMRALKRAANDHALAKREGIDYDAVLELREAQWEAALDRRNFLRRAGAVGAGLAIGGATFAGPAFAKSGDDGPSSASAARGRRQPRIVVVGAGISGLTAALSLKDAGVNATVYEASNRIGGRMFSDTDNYWSNGQVSEWGGELIDTDHEMIQGLAARFGLALDDLPSAEPRRSIRTLVCRMPTGVLASTTRSPATRVSARGTSTSQASTARRITRASWRVAQRKATAPPARSSAISASLSPSSGEGPWCAAQACHGPFVVSRHRRSWAGVVQ